MNTFVAAGLLFFSAVCFAQGNTGGKPPDSAAYPDAEAASAWRGLAAGYIRKALKDRKLDRDPALNARVDKVMGAVGAAVAVIDPRFTNAYWRAILIQDFGHGAAAFPGGIVLVDATFVRTLQLNDDELAMILSHEVAHVVAGHALAKLAFMADFLGTETLPTAHQALLEFLAKDSYAAVYQPTALMQEREADTLGAAILAATAYDAQRALGVFDKLAAVAAADEGSGRDTHDSAVARKRLVSGVLAEPRQFSLRDGPGPR